MEDGLSQGTVYSIAQDQKGFMWFGTLDGLNRFDGYEFKSFHQSKSVISCLFVSRDGKLWVGGYSGMFSQFDYRTESFIDHPLITADFSAKSNSPIFSIVEDEEGDLWVATLGDGVYRFNPDSNIFTVYRHNEKDNSSISSNRVKVLKIDSKKRLWLGTDDAGLSRFDKDFKTFVHFQHDSDNPDSLSHNTVASIYEDSQHRLWIGTRGGGLNLWNEEKENFISYRTNNGSADSQRINANRGESIASDNISSIIEEQPGILWLGTRFKGLNRFHIQSEHFEHFRSSMTDKQSLVDDYIRSSFKDDEGLIWFGTQTNGLSRFDLARTYFNHYVYDQSKPDGLGQPSINGFATQDNNTLWIAGTGVDKFDRISGKFTHYQESPTDKNSLVAGLVMMMYLDKNEHLWIATQKKGLNDYDIKNNSFTHYHQAGDKGYKISSNEIASVTPYDENHLWLGTYNVGVDLLNKKTGMVRNARYLQSNNGSNSNSRDEKVLLGRRVFTVLTDSKKRTWVATTKGVFKLNVETMMFQAINYHQLNSIFAIDLLEASNGDLWIATFGDGMFHVKHKSGTIIHYTQEQGLCDSIVYSLLEDKYGNIWLTSNKCLAMLNIKSLSFSIYDKRDGLQENEFNLKAAIKLPSGELAFGGINGFNLFYPENIKIDTQLPRVLLTEFFVFNQAVGLSADVKERELMSNNLVYLLEKSITYTDEVVLDYPFKMFGFSFSALNYKNSLSTQYQYKLAPWDENWISTSATERVAQYSNLPAGEYIFSVKAGNKNGYWNENPTSIKVIILPPPWKTWWAIMSYILCIVGLILIAVRVQQNKIKIKNREIERERKVSKRLSEINVLRDEFLANTSHELRTPLNGIIGIAETLLDGVAGEVNKETDENLSMIVTSGKRLANLVNDILDFSKLKNHDLELKISNVELFSVATIVVNLSRQLVDDKSLRMVNTITPSLYAVEADENRLQQILHNLIGNAVKFTTSGEIRISAEQLGEWVTVRVSDTGIGIPEDKLESIFDSFQQAEGSTAREFGGTGLGLSVSKKLVELHGGKIYVESSSAEGSTFIFTLRSGDITEYNDLSSLVEDHKHEKSNNNEIVSIDRHIEEITIENSETSSHTNSLDKNFEIEEKIGFKILIVDDEPVNRKVLNNHLKGKSYQLQEAKDGFNALHMIDEQTNFDMILLDIMMPKMSGYEACKKIREKYSVNDLPIIFLTAKNQAEDKAQGFNVGGNDFLTKPVNKLELLSRVNTHLQLLDINRNLERKVEERTMDLVEKNHLLANAQKRLITQEKMAALGSMTAGVAHEINNPTNYLHMTSKNIVETLNKFKEFVFTIVDDEADQDALKRFDGYFTPLFEFAELLNEGTDRLKDIVTDLRSFSRLDNSKLLSVPLTNNIKSTTNLVKVKYKGKIKIDVKEIDNVVIRCWPSRINQVFMNLLVNACQAIEQQQISESEKGCEFKLGQIEVIVYCNEDKGIVEIRDTGCGMSKSVMDHIFEPFFTTKDVDEGTGLGMSIVESIVHKHDGTIDVQSKLGVGTTFILTFPLA